MIFPRSDSPKKRMVPDLFSSEIQEMIVTIIANTHKNFPAYENLSIWNQACQTMYYELLHTSEEFYEKYHKIYQEDPEEEDDPQNQKEARKNLDFLKTRFRKKVQAGMRQLDFFSEVVRLLTLNFFAWEKSYVEPPKIKKQNGSELESISSMTLHEFILAIYKAMRYNTDKKFITPFFQEQKQQYFDKFKDTIHQICKSQLQKFALMSLGVPQDQMQIYMGKWNKRKLEKEIQLKNLRNISIIHLKQRKPRKPKLQTSSYQRGAEDQIFQLRQVVSEVTKIQGESTEKTFKKVRKNQTCRKDTKSQHEKDIKRPIASTGQKNPLVNYQNLRIRQKKLAKQQQFYPSAKEFDQDMFCCLALEKNQNNKAQKNQLADTKNKNQSLRAASCKMKDQSKSIIDKFLKQTALSLNNQKIKQQAQITQNIFEQTDDDQSVFSFRKQAQKPFTSVLKDKQKQNKKFAKFCQQFLNFSRSDQFYSKQLNKEEVAKPSESDLTQ